VKYIKPYIDFEKRSGIKPKFDKGDVVTNGINKILIFDINSTSDGAYYTVIASGSSVCPETGLRYIGINSCLEYHTFNRNHSLIKKGDIKTKYALSNGCHIPIEGVYCNDDIIEMALGNIPWHEYFENDWKNEWKIDSDV
jgi:hypothetical protein